MSKTNLLRANLRLWLENDQLRAELEQARRDADYYRSQARSASTQCRALLAQLPAKPSRKLRGVQ